MWVSHNSEIYDLLRAYEPSYAVEEPDYVFLNIHKPLERCDSPSSPIKLHDSTVNYFKIKTQSAEKPPTSRLHVTPKVRRKSFKLEKRETSTGRPTSRIKVRQLQSRAIVRRQLALSKEKVIELKKIFDRIDIDGNGRIDAGEFAKGLLSSIDRSDSMFNYFDIYMTGYVTFEEFLIRSFPQASQEKLTTMLNWVKEREREMRMTVNTRNIKKARAPKRKLTENTGRDYRLLFDLYDLNKDGFLDFEEISNALGTLISKERIKVLLERHGTNGKVDFQSFLNIMLPNDLIPDNLKAEER